MERTIKNGVTIISTGFTEVRNKTGYVGVTYRSDHNKYRVEINYKRRKYTLGHFAVDDIEAAAALRAEADRQVAAGTFLEWYAALASKRKSNR